MKKGILFILACLFQVTFLSAQKVYNIVDFGAVPDGKTLNTKHIQAAINECTKNGGGRVLIPNGTFLSGTIYLKNNVYLFLDATARLLGSPEYKTDYDWNVYGKGEDDENENLQRRALVYAYRQNNIGILGTGTIDGNGKHKNYKSKNMHGGIGGGVRPFPIWINECTNVKLHDFRAVDGSFWTIMVDGCNYVDVNGLTIDSRVIANNDGIDITDCSNVRIVNCDVKTGDDGICLKSNTKTVVRNVVISNCVVSSYSSCIKLGVASHGGFENINISNCALYDTRLSGINLKMVEGGLMDRVAITNITMHNVNGSIFMKCGANDNFDRAPSKMRNVIISNIIADGIGCWKSNSKEAYTKPEYDQRIGITITGQEESVMENVTLSNIHLQFAGGGTQADADRPFKDEALYGYPKYNNFGITPAYGINCKYLDGVRFQNIVLDYIEPDVRPAFYIENSKNITLDNIEAKISDNAKAYMRIQNIDGLMVRNCNPNSGNVPFLSLEGTGKDITVMGNDFSKIKSGLLNGNLLYVNYQYNIEKK